jgi:hypothetical protein
MRCEDAAEFVSALCNGEKIPPEAARHIGLCQACQTRLNAYSMLGVELRRIASLEEEGELKAGLWEQVPRVRLNWWQKARATMKIPRLAFALMLGLILLLSSGLVLVRARAGAGAEPVLVVTLRIPSGANIPPEVRIGRCSFLTNGDPTLSVCTFFAGTAAFFNAKIRFVTKEGEQSQLGVKARYENHPPPEGAYLERELNDVPEKTVWLEPGRKQEISVPGLGNVEITGEYLDYIPTIGSQPEETLEPQSNEFRIASPVLVRGKEVVFNFAGASAFGDSLRMKDPAVWIYVPGEGRYIISPVRFGGAVQATVQPGQIRFSLDGDDYILLTAMPATRSEYVWVSHDPQYRLKGGSDDSLRMGLTTLSKLLK